MHNVPVITVVLDFTALFGVPFVLNKKYVKSGDCSSAHIPTFSKKSRQQIEDEVRVYSFTAFKSVHEMWKKIKKTG